MPWDAEIAALPVQLRDIALLASQAALGAYANESRFSVGAALRLSKPRLPPDRQIVTAVNVENGSYGLTSCAERNAIFRAVAQHGPDIKWDLIAVVAHSAALIPGKRHTVSPCGACRQVLDEFKADDSARVLFLKAGAFETEAMSEVLPFPFVLERESP